MTTKFDELVAKLKEIFQIDKPELDFGIYKIVNAKAEMIQKFLTNDLKAKVQMALADKASAGKKALEDKIAKIEATLAPLGVQPSSSAEWVAAKAELDKLATSDDSESLVYAHLLTFFSRYYDDGDFISKRRYKEGQYAIPYSGEEVKLHWANADQYYTKSGENFTNYDFTIDGKKVHFKLVQAAVAKDNVKDNDCVRCFVLWDPASAPKEGEEGYDENLPTRILEVKDGGLYIYFQYKKFPKGTKQKDFADAAYAAIQQKMTEDGLMLNFPVFKEAPTEADKHRTVLTREFTRYMAKNTSDYFIHKNLRKFLTQELDNYVKTEMMNLDDISNAATFDMIASNLRLIQTFRLIATELIAFMSQLEDFQKKLWLKKKFVVQCDYCITMDQIPEDLWAEVLANKAQLDEWKKYGVDVDPKTVDMHALDARMVDTKFFDDTFKAKLLRSIPDLDEHCDGLLIHSENFQALNLLQERFRERVRLIYIDPPYNTGSDNAFLYKDNYQHSSWLMCLEERMGMSRILLQKLAGILVSTDDGEYANLRVMMGKVFGDTNFVADIIWNSRKSVSSDALLSGAINHTTFFANDKSELETFKDKFRLPEDGKGFINPDNDPELMVNGRIMFGKTGKGRPGYKRFLSEAITKGKTTTTLWDDVKTTTEATNMLLDQFGMSIPKISIDQIKPKPIEMIARPILLFRCSNELVLDYFGGSGTTAHAVIDINRQNLERGIDAKCKYILVEMGDHFDTVLMPRVKKVVYAPDWKDGKPVSTAKGISHCFKYMTLESYEDTLNNLKLEKPGELGILQNEYMLNYMLEIESRKSLLGLDKFAHPFDYTLDLAVDSSGATKPQKVDMVETFNYLIGLRVQLVDRNISKGYVLVHGELPSGEETLVLWRDLGKVDNAELKKILDKQGIHPREKGFVLYVNGDHNLPNTVKEDGEEKTIKVRSIEADFNRQMFEET